MVLLAVRHSSAGLEGAASKCPLRNPDEHGRPQGDFRRSGEVQCRQPNTPQSEDTRSEANTCSPALEPFPSGDGSEDSWFGMVPANSKVDGMDELVLDVWNSGDETLDFVEQWLSSGTVSGGQQTEALFCIPVHGGYPDPSKAVDWRWQSEPCLRHYPCSHTGGGRRTECPDRVPRISHRASGEGRERPQLVQLEPHQETHLHEQRLTMSSEHHQQHQHEQQEHHGQVPQVPMCQSSAHPNARDDGLLGDIPQQRVSIRAKARQLLRQRIARRLRIIDFDRSAKNLSQS